MGRPYKLFKLLFYFIQVLTTGLLTSALQSGKTAAYIKPVQTGVNSSSTDVDFVHRYCLSPLLKTKTLFSYAAPLSPHVAVKLEKSVKIPKDEEVCSNVEDAVKELGCEFTFIETAGGVLSPGPKATPQADMYKSSFLFRKVILIADGKLGGISTSLTSLESLLARHYLVKAILVIENQKQMLGNSQFLTEYTKLPVFSFGELPNDPHVEITQWYQQHQVHFDNVLRILSKNH